MGGDRTMETTVTLSPDQWEEILNAAESYRAVGIPGADWQDEALKEAAAALRDALKITELDKES